MRSQYMHFQSQPQAQKPIFSESPHRHPAHRSYSSRSLHAPSPHSSYRSRPLRDRPVRRHAHARHPRAMHVHTHSNPFPTRHPADREYRHSSHELHDYDPYRIMINPIYQNIADQMELLPASPSTTTSFAASPKKFERQYSYYAHGLSRRCAEISNVSTLVFQNYGIDIDLTDLYLDKQVLGQIEGIINNVMERL